VRLVRAGGQAVELVGTVHIGQPGYYAGLQSSCLSGHDMVLYEMITSEANVAPAGPRRERLGVALQAPPSLRQMAEAHGLEPQLDCLDLDRDGWCVRALVPSVLLRPHPLP
jgi:hypothetical protein